MTLKSFDDGNSTEARQSLLDRRDERNHPKRHRTKGRRIKLNAKKRQKIKHNRAVNKAARARHIKKVRAYWAGETDEHPIS